MLFTVIFTQSGSDPISHTSASKLEIYSHYIDYCTRSATLAAMVPGSSGNVQVYNDTEKIMEFTAQSADIKIKYGSKTWTP